MLSVLFCTMRYLDLPNDGAVDDMTRRLDDLEASLTVSAEGRESGSGSGRGTPK